MVSFRFSTFSRLFCFVFLFGNGLEIVRFLGTFETKGNMFGPGTHQRLVFFSFFFCQYFDFRVRCSILFWTRPKKEAYMKIIMSVAQKAVGWLDKRVQRYRKARILFDAHVGGTFHRGCWCCCWRAGARALSG